MQHSRTVGAVLKVGIKRHGFVLETALRCDIIGCIKFSQVPPGAAEWRNYGRFTVSGEIERNLCFGGRE